MGSLDYVSNPADLPPGTLSQLFLSAVDDLSDEVAFRYFPGDGDHLEDLTYGAVFDLVRAVSGGLRALGLEAGDRAAILSETRFEWSVCDYACICSGILDVPIYSTLTVPQVAYILENSGASLVFTSTPDQARKVKAASREAGLDIQVVVFDASDSLPEGVVVWEDFLETGRLAAAEVDDDSFRATALETAPDDLATLLYTSGTTGKPKGVMLTHNNLWSNVTAASRALPREEGDTALVFLPLSHVLQRMVSYLFFSRGDTAAYAHSINTVGADMRVVRPSAVVSVPRLYEKVYNTVMEAEGLKKRLVQWAREVGDAWADEKLAGREPSGVLKLVYRIADALVFKKIRAAMGGRIRYFVSGGAPLAPDINRFFFGAGIWILEGYGLTETSPVTNVNSFDGFRIGTVGKPVAGTEIRIAENGEILIRGPQVMKGYYNLPEATAEAIDSEGWFHTGDVGEIDEDGFLRITDRIKDIIVTAQGKNVAPQPIENLLKTNDYVEQAVMIGDRQSFCVILIVPSIPNLESWARKIGVEVSDTKALLARAEVQELMEEQVFGVLKGLARYEMPKKIGLVESPFSIEDGTLTPTQKVKRRAVEARYRELIEAFYLEENLDQTVFLEP
jgi:long-chain acyl-CoA synthetase